jgi:hypothetical protein
MLCENSVKKRKRHSSCHPERADTKHSSGKCRPQEMPAERVVPGEKGFVRAMGERSLSALRKYPGR